MCVFDLNPFGRAAGAARGETLPKESGDRCEGADGGATAGWTLGPREGQRTAATAMRVVAWWVTHPGARAARSRGAARRGAARGSAHDLQHHTRT